MGARRCTHNSRSTHGTAVSKPDALLAALVCTLSCVRISYEGAGIEVSW